MTITVESNGLEFSFPDGTTTQQIGKAISGYFAENPPKTNIPDSSNYISDMWTGFKRGMVGLGENLGGDIFAPSVPESVREAVKNNQIEGAVWAENQHPYLDEMPETKTIPGEIAEAVPSMVSAIPGWELGAERAALLLPEKAPAALSWLVKGLGGSIGGDITSGEVPTASGVAEGGLANVIAETVFHTPQGLRLASAMIQRNEQAIMDAADHIGVTPTAAMASMRRWVPIATDLSSKLPGGHLITVANKKVLDGLEAFSDQVKRRLGYKGDTTGLGEAIKSGIEGYEQRFKDGAEKAYDEITKQVGAHQMTNTRRFVRKVEELYGVNPLPGIDKMTAPPIVRKYMEYIEDAGKIPQDTGYSNLPMSLNNARKALKLLDDYIGTGEQADADTAAAKQMATALREDIGVTFEALGVGDKWRDTQSRYAAGLAIIKQAQTVFNGAKGGDDFYRRLFGNPWEGFKAVGPDVVNTLKNVLPKDLTDRIAAEFIHRMGLEGAGVATAEGRMFSPVQYLTNWTKLNDAGSIDALFGGATQTDAEALAKVSEGIKRAGKSVNHSNTASHAALWQMVSVALLHPIIGIPKLAVLAGGNALLSLVLTHPQAARILATAEGDAARGWFAKHIPALVAISTADPKLRQAFDDAIGGDAAE